MQTKTNTAAVSRELHREGLDADTVERTVKTLSSHLLALERIRFFRRFFKHTIVEPYRRVRALKRDLPQRCAPCRSSAPACTSCTAQTGLRSARVACSTGCHTRAALAGQTHYERSTPRSGVPRGECPMGCSKCQLRSPPPPPPPPPPDGCREGVRRG